MKLLIILSIAEYADEVRKMMSENNVPIFSETEMHGFRTEKYHPDVRSWFSQGDYGVYSTLFFSFQSKEKVSHMLDEIRAYNERYKGDRDNPLHAYQVDVEAFV